MMAEEIKRPKVFISYSWKPDADKEFVKEIADRLVGESGIEVMLDRYDLKPGDDKYVYMEKMVTDETINKVLIFSNQEYARKADNREGGVGTESTIISQEVYGKVKQNKFIPIILEKNEKGEPCLPTFIKPKIHFDFSDLVKFEDEYEKLVRFLYNKPLDKKPALGEIPAFIKEDDPIKIRVHYKLERFKNAVLEGRKNIPVLIEDYLETFYEDISQLKIEGDNREVPLDEKVYDMIVKMKPYRDNFLEFFEWMIKLDTTDYIEYLHKHIETWNNLKILDIDDSYYRDKLKRYSEHYKFFFKELFQYIITLALLKDKYDVAEYLINTPYLVRKRSGATENTDFTFLYNYCEILDKDRNNRLGSNRLSIATDILVSEDRIYKKITVKNLQDTDRLFHYITLIKGDYSFWFPYLTMYNVDTLNLMKRAESKRVFERIKGIFQVNSVEELKIRISQIPESKRNKYFHGYDLIDIYHGLNVDKLASK